MVDRRMLLNIDWLLVVLALMLGGWGLITVYSATHGRLETHLNDLYLKQICWFGVGLGLMVLITLVDYQSLSRSAYAFFTLGIMLLIAVLVFGRMVSGARRWLVLGPISFQPSELVKVFLVLSLAPYFTD